MQKTYKLTYTEFITCAGLKSINIFFSLNLVTYSLSLPVGDSHNIVHYHVSPYGSIRLVFCGYQNSASLEGKHVFFRYKENT